MLTRALRFHRETVCPPEAPEDGFFPISLILESYRSRTGFSAKSLFPCMKVQKAQQARQSLFSVMY